MRLRLVLFVLFFLTPVLVLLAAGTGSYQIAPETVLQALVADLTEQDLTQNESPHVLWHLRLPRIGMVVGAALGMAGTSM